MDKANEQEISETVIAAYLADELDPAQRADLTAILAANPAARELLRMSYKAMKTGRTKKRDRDDAGRV